jgi:hypothetical protein
MDHIPKPVSPGTVYPYQSGWIFTVVGADGNDYYIKTVTYDRAAQAKQAMRLRVIEMNK